IFANLGTDHVSLIEELARWDKEGRKHPEMILCPHEVVAVHMAGGYALATGRGQAVLVHVDAGTANACMSIQNLFRYRLPVMLFAGRAPHTLHGELTGSAMPMCISCRTRSTSPASCAPTSSGNTRCHRAWW